MINSEQLFLIDPHFGFLQNSTDTLSKESEKLINSAENFYFFNPSDNFLKDFSRLSHYFYRNLNFLSESDLFYCHYHLGKVIHAITYENQSPPHRILWLLFLRISRKCGVPAVLTYFDVILNNFCFKSEKKDERIHNTFTHNKSEVNFIWIHCKIEQSLSDVSLLATQLLKQKDNKNFIETLIKIYENIPICLLNAVYWLSKMHSLVEPDFFHDKIRLFYNGIGKYNGVSGAQSPSFTLLDLLLLIKHRDSFHKKQARYMHPRHRYFLSTIEKMLPKIRAIVESSNQTTALLKEGRAMLSVFRGSHLKIVEKYLIRYGTQYGTGGKTKKFLSEIRNETQL